MPCQTLNIDGRAVHINFAGPTKEIHREPKGVRWCFTCRKRQEFFLIVTADVEPSYYPPNPSIRCASCNTDDGDCFPGTSREWEE